MEPIGLNTNKSPTRPTFKKVIFLLPALLIILIAVILFVFKVRGGKTFLQSLPSSSKSTVDHINPDAVIYSFPATILKTTGNELTVRAVDPTSPLSKGPKLADFTVVVSSKTEILGQGKSYPIKLTLQDLKIGQQVNISTKSSFNTSTKAEALSITTLPTLPSLSSPSSASPFSTSSARPS